MKGADTMAQTTISFRIDEDLKRSVEQVCDDLGMNMTTAFMIFAKKMAREKRIPFEVSADPFFSENNAKALENSFIQLEQGKVISKTIEELEAMEQDG